VLQGINIFRGIIVLGMSNMLYYICPENIYITASCIYNNVDSM